MPRRLTPGRALALTFAVALALAGAAELGARALFAAPEAVWVQH